MSHAYVEVGDVAVAGRILRGEGGGLDENPNFGKKKERSSVLGKGRRARGVTVTRSGQEELMADVRFSLIFSVFVLPWNFSDTFAFDIPIWLGASLAPVFRNSQPWF